MRGFGRVLPVAGLLAVLAASATAQQPAQDVPKKGMMDRGMIDQDRGGWMGPGMRSGMMNSMVRHRYYMRHGIPANYRGKADPLASTLETVRDGARLYAENCASCHGAKGFGDGEAGRGLNPAPANLAHMTRMPMLGDDYLLWTMSEGGAPVGSSMPAFKEILTEHEMWKIVAAMRAGFPTPPRPAE